MNPLHLFWVVPAYSAGTGVMWFVGHHVMEWRSSAYGVDPRTIFSSLFWPLIAPALLSYAACYYQSEEYRQRKLEKEMKELKEAIDTEFELLEDVAEQQQDFRHAKTSLESFREQGEANRE